MKNMVKKLIIFEKSMIADVEKANKSNRAKLYNFSEFVRVAIEEKLNRMQQKETV